MSLDYWKLRWQHRDIAWHLNQVQPSLMRFWPSLQVPVSKTVFVPLCGKSLDMKWLAEQGYRVSGVEISELACESFFEEHQLISRRRVIPDFIVYESANFQIFCGDFYHLVPGMISDIGGVYDRASLFALSAQERPRYIEHLRSLILPETRILLLSYETQDTVQGPPFPVFSDEIRSAYEDAYIVNEVLRKTIDDLSDFSPYLITRGYKTLDIVVYTIYPKQLI